MVSLWPRSLGEVALEDRRAMADMLVANGELAGVTMLSTPSLDGRSYLFGDLSSARAREILRCAQDDGGGKESLM